MSRVINTNSPGKRRHYHMRTIAEILRHLAQKQAVDDETKDMVATLAIALTAIDATVIESITAWEKRNYWKKADEFQQKWFWASRLRTDIENLVRADDWQQLPDIMMKLYPHFADIEINKQMRKADTWEGAYHELMTRLNR